MLAWRELFQEIFLRDSCMLHFAAFLNFSKFLNSPNNQSTYFKWRGFLGNIGHDHDKFLITVVILHRYCFFSKLTMHAFWASISQFDIRKIINSLFHMESFRASGNFALWNICSGTIFPIFFTKLKQLFLLYKIDCFFSLLFLITEQT